MERYLSFLKVFKFSLLLMACFALGCGGPAAPLRIAYTEISPFEHGPTRSVFGIIDSIDKTKLSFPIAGKIDKVSVGLSDYVSEGQTVASLVAEQFESARMKAKADLDGTLEQLKNKAQLLKVAEQMYNANLGSKSAFDKAAKEHQDIQAELANKEQALQVATQALDRTILKSSKAGLVAKLDVAAGDYVGVGQALFEIHPEGSLRVVLNVPEDIVPMLAKEDPALVNIEATKQKKLAAKIDSIAPIPAGSNAAPVLILVGNQAGLRAGMSAEVILSVLDKKAPVWLLAKNIVFNWNTNSPFVYVYLVEKGIVEKRAVKTGAEQGDQISIVAGLVLGEKVITQAAGELKEGQRVTAVAAEEIPVFLQKQLDISS